MRRRTALRSLAAGLLLTAGLSACASSGGSSGSEGTSGSAPPAATAPDPTAAVPDNAPAESGPVTTVAPGDVAPIVPEVLDVQATLVGGGDIDLAAFAGKPLALWFWAPT